MWTAYGRLLQDRSVFFVNLVGSILATGYVASFLAFCSPAVGNYAKRLIMFSALIGAGIGLYLVVLDEEARLNTLGLLCAALSVALFGAPLVGLVLGPGLAYTDF